MHELGVTFHIMDQLEKVAQEMMWKGSGRWFWSWGRSLR